MRVNVEGRLLHIDEGALLGGFEKRPGSHPWIGEHIGKYLDAASRAWAYTGDERLKLALDRMAHNLIAMQLPDGYLGTYTEEQRWTSWDVWVHKYCLIGLLSYYQVTGDAPALETARRVADLLVTTFGEGPGQRDILRSGTHMGMAATSILEPFCVLYRYTGEQKYLDFARYVIRSWDQPNGPKIIRSLTRTGSVAETANGKAYEMLSNLVGLVELYRLTAEASYLKAAETAWNDIAAKRLYITGTTSAAERFRGDFDLPGEESASVGEGCATVSWLQLTWQLLRVTGEPQYADHLERTVYNQLLGAQDPENGNICSYTPLVGRKHPSSGIGCCVSSEPRGIAMIPELTWGLREGGLAILLYAPGEATVPLRDGYDIGVLSKTEFPRDGAITLTIRPTRPARFPIFLRVPAWTARFAATVNDEAFPGEPGRFLRLERAWRWGDTIKIDMDLTVHVVPGGLSYPDSVAVTRGPQVLALEAGLNPQIAHLHRTALRSPETVPALAGVPAPESWNGDDAWSTAGIAGGKPQPIVLVPFADAVKYRVWLLRPNRIPVGAAPATAFGAESWSRDGSVPGSICDDRADTYRTTFEGRPARSDWYAVQMEKPAVINRVVYRHGKVFENGGWFDTSAGRPKIQIKRPGVDQWEDAGTLDAYPELTSAQVPGLRDGEPFTLKLKEPVRASAVRITGKPARSFSTCAELAAYAQ